VPSHHGAIISSHWVDEQRLAIELPGCESALGWVTAGRRRVAVRMLEPFPGLERSCGANRWRRQVYRDAAGLTTEGRALAEWLLADLHAHGAFIARHGQALREQWQALQTADAADPSQRDHLDDGRFRAGRSALRRQLRHQGLDIRSYERRLRALRARNDAWHQSRLSLASRFTQRVEAQHGMWITPDDLGPRGR
jgi:hypothetical protein